jgi:hypothetical protein
LSVQFKIKKSEGQKEMPNCCCEKKFHKDIKIVTNCKSKRGVIKRTGAKRIDSVVAEHMEAEEKKKEELSKTTEKEEL